MRVLVLEDRPGQMAATEARLHQAGHVTVGCDDPDGDVPASCRALHPGGSCPLEDGPVHAALLAGGSNDSPSPPGLRCVARRHVPTLSLAGIADVDAVDVVTAIEQVAAIAPPGHRAAAHRAARRSLDIHGSADVGLEAEVTRDGGHLHIRLTTDRAIPSALTHAAAIRALAAVRTVDPTAPTIGVSGPRPRAT